MGRRLDVREGRGGAVIMVGVCQGQVGRRQGHGAVRLSQSRRDDSNCVLFCVLDEGFITLVSLSL